MIAVLAAFSLFAAPADSAEAAPSTGPLEPGSIGLGFRVLGDAPEILARYALSPRWSLGLAASGTGAYVSHDNTASERTFTSFKVALPLEVIPACRGNVCATIGFGPFYRLAYSLVQEEKPFRGVSYMEEGGTIQHIGLTTSVGARWEFAPGIALAASWGADVYGILADDSRTVYTTWRENDANEFTEGFAATTWNGGIGLDVWF